MSDDTQKETTISVRVMDGDSGTLPVSLDDSAEETHQRIIERFGVRADGLSFRIFHKGVLLDPVRTLREQGLTCGDSVMFGSLQQFRQFEDDAHVRIRGLPR